MLSTFQQIVRNCYQLPYNNYFRLFFVVPLSLFPYILKKIHLNVILIHNVHLAFLQETLLYKIGRLRQPYYSSIYLIFLITFCWSMCVDFCWLCFAKKLSVLSQKRKEKCSSLWFKFYIYIYIYLFIYISILGLYNLYFILWDTKFNCSIKRMDVLHYLD